MTKPSEKSPEITTALDGFTQVAFGRTRTESIENDICVTCGKEAKDFKDVVSAKEYKISGMCQICQDETFKPDEED